MVTNTWFVLWIISALCGAQQVNPYGLFQSTSWMINWQYTGRSFGCGDMPEVYGQACMFNYPIPDYYAFNQGSQLYQNTSINASKFDDFYAYYSNLTKLERWINTNNNDTNRTVLSDMIFCQIPNNPMCDRSNKIGPSDQSYNNLSPLFPVQININLNPNDTGVVMIDTSEYNSNGLIYIYAAAYVIYENPDNTPTFAANATHYEIFPNAQSFSHIAFYKNEVFPGGWMQFKISYQSSYEDIWKDLGHPEDWKSMFSDYYFVIENDNGETEVVYLYGLSVYVLNGNVDDIYAKWLSYNGPTIAPTSPPTTTASASERPHGIVTISIVASMIGLFLIIGGGWYIYVKMCRNKEERKSLLLNTNDGVTDTHL